MADLTESLQHNAMPPPSFDSAVSIARRGSEVSPSRSSFPSSNASRIHTPSTSIPSTPIVPTRPPSPEKRPAHPGESDNFLTALATQERRVLELKEELQKAEMDLEKLKKQWAAHEAKKKRNETRNSEQLQQLKTCFPEKSSPIREESPVLASSELDRRKTLSSGTRSSQRKVFSGSRHTRTLSLLSTSNPKVEPQYPPRGDSLTSKARGSLETVEAIPELDIPQTPSSKIREPSKNSDRDMIIETGRQLVGDFRQGFWTFVEDLKQVTVGDEASPAGEVRSFPKGNFQGPKKSVGKVREVVVKQNSASNAGKQEGMLGEQHDDPGLSSQQAKGAIANGTTSSKSPDSYQQGLGILSDSNNEGWDNWETPKANSSRPESVEQGRTLDLPTSSPLTDQSSPRTSVSDSQSDATFRPKGLTLPTNKSDAIPWPTLSQLSPSRLSKTASTLMSEWEKSMSPSTNGSKDAAVSKIVETG